MTTEELIKSGKFKIAAIAVGLIIMILISFASGVMVGFRKARFSYNFGENYERNFMGPHFPGPGGFMREFEGRDFRNGHGLAGTVISISDSSLVVKDRDNKENTVTITDKTIIKDRGNDMKIGDLKTDQRITVIGRPGDNGVINADFIRVFEDNRSPNSQN